MATIYLHTKDLHKKNKVYSIPNTIIASSDLAYSILEDERLGEGGHAAVYKCIENTSGIEYAIKFQLNFSAKAIKRFINSIEVLKKLKHNNLLRYVDSGYIETCNKKIYYLIMDLYENGNLEDKLCFEKKEFKPEEYIAQFLNLSHGLAAFHKYSVHRDIKPANILLGDRDWVLADYGLCTLLQGDKITRDTERVGPVLWMTPEAINKAISVEDEINKSSDVYQLASIFWFVVNHKHPTGILTKKDWIGPDWLFPPIYKALSHNKLKRYKDGNSFYIALRRAQLNQ